MTTAVARATGILARLFLFWVCLSPPDSSWAAVRVWDGGGADSNWANPTNWAGNVAPATADSLMFPAGALRGTNFNNFPPDTAFTALTFSGADYAVTGARISLLQGIQLSGAGNVRYALPTVLMGSQTFSNGSSGTFHIEGAVTGGNGVLEISGGGDVFVSGVLSGSLSLVKRGINTLTLATNNTYSGSSVIHEGVLVISTDEALGASDGENVVIMLEAALRLAGGVSLNKPILSLQGGLQAVGGTNTVNSFILLDSSNVTVRVEANTDLSLGGALEGSLQGILSKAGPGRLTFAGSDDNFYDADTFVVEGELRLNKTLGTVAIPGRLIVGDGFGGPGADVVRLTSSSQISDNGMVVINSSGLLDLNNNVDAIGPLELRGGTVTTIAGILILRGDVLVHASTNTATMHGNITLTQGATRRFTVAEGAPGSDLVIHARMDSSGGTGLTKEGPGQMQLLANNLYVGNTVVKAGKLVVDGSQTVSSVVVMGGTLAGQGNLGVISATGGEIAPGASPGLLRCRGINWSTPASFLCEINGTNVVTDYDQVRVTGAVNLQNAILQLSLGFAPSLGQNFLIIDNDGTDPVTGNFQGLPEGAFVQTNGAAFRISYVGGSGNDVELARATPPPMIAAVGFTLSRQLTINGTALPNQNYALEISTNLVNWSELIVRQTDNTGAFEFTDPMSAILPKRFYRICARGPAL